MSSYKSTAMGTRQRMFPRRSLLSPTQWSVWHTRPANGSQALSSISQSEAVIMSEPESLRVTTLWRHSDVSHSFQHGVQCPGHHHWDLSHRHRSMVAIREWRDVLEPFLELPLVWKKKNHYLAIFIFSFPATSRGLRLTLKSPVNNLLHRVLLHSIV